MDELKKRIVGVNHWLVSVLLNLIIPLIPLVIEYSLTQKLSDSTAVLAASMYSVSTGVVSRLGVIVVTSLGISIFYAAIYGALVFISIKPELKGVDLGSFNAMLVLVLLLITNIVLKFWQHVIDLRPYSDFSLRTD